MLVFNSQTCLRSLVGLILNSTPRKITDFKQTNSVLMNNYL